MCVVRCVVMKGFSTGCASKCSFGSSLVMCFKVTIESRFSEHVFITAGAFKWFLSGVNAVMLL